MSGVFGPLFKNVKFTKAHGGHLVACVGLVAGAGAAVTIAAVHAVKGMFETAVKAGGKPTANLGVFSVSADGLPQAAADSVSTAQVEGPAEPSPPALPRANT